jgi:hypothetical protein
VNKKQFRTASWVTLTAIPEPGYAFVGWGGQGCEEGLLFINGSKSCKAYFEALDSDQLKL